MRSKLLRKICLYASLLLVVSVTNATTFEKDSIKFQLETTFNKAKKIRYNSLTRANDFLKKEYNQFISKGDSIKAIHVLMERADVFSHQANYNKSYDILWRALIMADSLKKESLKAEIYLKIGRLYTFFHKKEEAIKYLNMALEINKNLIKKGILSKDILLANHYNFSATYRDLKDFKNAKKHLDSCNLYYVNNDLLNINYLKFEKTFTFLNEGHLDKGLQTLNEIEPWFIANEPSYLVLIYTNYGDLYSKSNKVEIAETYYKKALDISKRFNAHIDFSPLIYEKLATLYLKMEDYKKAYENDHKAKKLDAQFFDSRSNNNRSLLEIKDTYLIQQQQQDAVIKEQQLSKLKQDDRILLLQRVILFVVLTSTLIIGLLYLTFVKTKHKNEKQLQELELIKTTESLELKNKELTGFALQLAEKDEFLRELKSKLKVGNDKINIDEIKQISKSITVSNERSWQEFRLRFTAVNEVFYNKLGKEYPKLSQRDQKICAFIKLNLSSKKMASLLGISVESVHTIRYRLRKKLDLSSDINLEEFIANL